MGSRSFDKREVPYPLSIDKKSIELSVRSSSYLVQIGFTLSSRWSLDRALMYRVKSGCSFVDFKGRTPRRCLDLGTGVRGQAASALGILT